MVTRGNLTFMTWNTNGVKSKVKEVISEIEKHNCHVAYIQETHIGSSDKNVFKSFDKWTSFVTKYNSQERGVAILIRRDILNKSKICTRKDPAGCFVVVKCTLKGQLYTLVSVYTHQIDSRPLKKLRLILENFAEGVLLIGGDFNIALNPYLDRDSSTLNERHFMLRPTVEKFITSFHLVDVWRRFNPICRKYTYFKNNLKKSLTKSRLDYLFVPEESMQYVKSCKISVETCRSDHQPILFQIRKTETNQRNISDFTSNFSQQWHSCEQKIWHHNFKLNPHAFKMVQVMDVEKAIQSLAVNKNKVKRPDGISLLFYQSHSYVLIPYLCVFYHNLLKQLMNVPESFNKTYDVSGIHYIFNIDYLILATIMARWLDEHLDSCSTNYTVDKTSKTVLFAFKKGPKKVKWSVLKNCLIKEHHRNPPLPTKFSIDVLEMLLKNSGEYKSLCWGCPLSPVLMRLCLTHVAEKFLKSIDQSDSEVYICKENVIVKVSGNVSRDFLEKAEGELPTVHCTFVDELKSEQSK